jgi:hypothetical protein
MAHFHIGNKYNFNNIFYISTKSGQNLGEKAFIPCCSALEFSENECNKRCILHEGATQFCLFFYIFHPILIKFSTDVHKVLLAHYEFQ